MAKSNIGTVQENQLSFQYDTAFKVLLLLSVSRFQESLRTGNAFHGSIDVIGMGRVFWKVVRRLWHPEKSYAFLTAANCVSRLVNSVLTPLDSVIFEYLEAIQRLWSLPFNSLISKTRWRPHCLFGAFNVMYLSSDTVSYVGSSVCRLYKLEWEVLA